MYYKKLVIIDYKMGNIKSVYNALKYLNLNVEISNNRKKIQNSFGIILPGVGAFGDAIKNLIELKIFDIIKKEILNGKPYLGICLGLQILFHKSEESPEVNGFSILNGNVIKFKNKKVKVPHIGWNTIKIIKKSTIFEGIKNNSYFYFDHSYYVAPEDKSIIAAKTDYGEIFCSAIIYNNIYGVQFHPEKSHKNGLLFLKNFVSII